jgi:hypothetical protein
MLLALALSSAAACTTPKTGGLSLVDYASVNATPPPQDLTGLWAGPHAGGTFFVQVFDDGGLRTCLSAPPYYQALDGKYSDQALHLEDGARIEFENEGPHRITIYSPPGKPVTTLQRSAASVSAEQCLAGAADVQRKIAHWASH